MSTTPDYFDRYENFALMRSESGVLTLRFHTNGGPVTFTGTTHSDCRDCSRTSRSTAATRCS